MPKLDNNLINLILVVIFSTALVIVNCVLGESLNNLLYNSIPVVLLVILYLLLQKKMNKFENSVREILESRIPNISYIEDGNAITTEFINAINSAEKYIMTTGGKTRNINYLSVIKENINNKDIEYYRILFGEDISQELYNHLIDIIEKDSVYVSYTPRELASFLLLTENVAFIGLPDADPKEFRRCLKIPNINIIERLAKYIRSWYKASEKVDTKKDLERLLLD